MAWNKAESGASVLINIPTGEILAMASYPDFNPNNREGATLNDFRNRAVKGIRMGINDAVRLHQPLLQCRHQNQRLNGGAGFEGIANGTITKIV